ncbi:MAG: DUF6116 family protein [Acidobacteriota bacterium]
MADSKTSESPSPRGVAGVLERLRSSTLFTVVALIFAVDLVVPDMLPFVDEVVLGAATILLARWRLRRTEPEPAEKPPPKNVTPPAG